MAILKLNYAKEHDYHLTEHFKVYEFASKSGSILYSNTVLVDTALLQLLEELMSALKSQTCIIVSGYRTPEHDRAVGGNGRGQHTLGKAADCYFLDKKKKVISAKLVCCVAQELGFNGIANINADYKNVHLDTGSRAKRYLGDETKGTNSVTTDFYKYFGITRKEIDKQFNITPKKEYYQKPIIKTASIIDALKSIKVDSSLDYRKKIAKANSITLYSGTAKQNSKMLKLLVQGKLIKA